MGTRTVAKWALETMAAGMPLPLLERLSDVDLVVTYYHVVSDRQLPHIRHLYGYRGVRAFEADMDALLSRYAPLDLPELIDALDHGRPDGRRRGKPRFMVTFDDGLREFADEVAPILRRKGIPATIFVATGVLDNKDLLYRHKASLLADRLNDGVGSAGCRAARRFLDEHGIAGGNPAAAVLSIDYPRRALLDELASLIEVDFRAYLERERPYLTVAEVRGLVAAGFAVGAHSRDHPPYRQIPFDEQVAQTLSSVRTVRQSFGLDYGAFAFPFNDLGLPRKLFDVIFANGVDVAFGTSGFRDDPVPRSIQRVGFESNPRDVTRQLAERYARKAILRAAGRAVLFR